MTRREFPAKVRVAAFERAAGRCEREDCRKQLFPGDIFYDHVIPDALGGEPTLENCQVLCKSHHDPKTRAEDIPRIAKTKRIHQKHVARARKYRWPKRPFSREYRQ